MRSESGKSVNQVFDTFLARVYRDVDQGMDRVADVYVRHLKLMLNQRGTGRKYRRRAVRYGRRKDGSRGRRLKDRISDFHVASAPGRPPAPDTRALYNSVFKARTGPRTREVGVNAPYADDLENGTRNMAPRPFMRPAMEAAKVEMGGSFVRSLREEGYAK